LKLAVAYNQHNYFSRAKALSVDLRLPFFGECRDPRTCSEFEYLLLCSASGLAVQVTGKGKQGPVRVDLSSAKLQYRRRSGHNEMLGRACGVKASFIPKIIDGTAGLGKDSFILADMGCDVILVERSPIVAMLLEDGLERARKSDQVTSAARMHLVTEDGIKYLSNLEWGAADVVYLDPMFPERSKSAKVKKEMQVFHLLVGESHDDAELLDAARTVAKYRVVVKRPINAPLLADQRCSFELRGKTIRYDVYTNRKLP